MICPDCDGRKRLYVHLNRGAGRSGFEWIDCFRCKGSGEVPDEQAVWILEGVKLRTERIALGRSVREQAKLFGISPVELSEIERGMRPVLTQESEPPK